MNKLSSFSYKTPIICSPSCCSSSHSRCRSFYTKYFFSVKISKFIFWHNNIENQSLNNFWFIKIGQSKENE